MSENKSSSGGVGFCGLLAIVFIILKLCNVIAWSWWWVLCPLWAPFGVFLIVFGGLYLFAFIKVTFFSTPKQKEQVKSIREEEKKSAGKSKWEIRMEEMQKAQRIKKLCEDLPGKRAIHHMSKYAGIITSVKPDSEGDDVWIVLDFDKIGGHHHYFYIEGEAGTNGDLFEKNKPLHWK